MIFDRITGFHDWIEDRLGIVKKKKKKKKKKKSLDTNNKGEGVVYQI